MSKFRVVRQQAKTLLWNFMRRLGRAARARRKMGQPISKNWQRNFGMPDFADARDRRAHWRRWYRANKRHQAEMRRLRRAGCNVLHIPHSLRLNWVP